MDTFFQKFEFYIDVQFIACVCDFMYGDKRVLNNTDSDELFIFGNGILILNNPIPGGDISSHLKLCELVLG